jgi:iron complex outermembrane recepter protein
MWILCGRLNREKQFSISPLLSCLGILLMFTAFLPKVATATDSAEENNDSLQEIVVTAEKRNSTVQDTAISMTAFSGDQLLRQGTQSIEDLVGNVPGLSMRSAGPGQTEYEMRGMGANGGSTATVGFYVDDVLISASAASQGGRTVIDPDLFDLNHVEVLRGPQGTLYGAGSMGGTIKLVTNQPKLGTFEGAASVDASETASGGSTNGGGNLMLNFPIGDVSALRLVVTDKYISGWIDRKVVADFPYPTSFGTCNSAYYFCDRGNLTSATVTQTITGSNLERFASARASLLVVPSDSLKITGTLMYQRIDADGYNAYQIPPGASGGYSIYQPYNIAEPYYDSFKLAALSVHYDWDAVELTSATSYWSRESVQSQDSTESVQNIFNLTQFIPNLEKEYDPTTQSSEELRLTSRGSGPLDWVAGVFLTDLHSGYSTVDQNPAFAGALACAVPYSGGNCPPGYTYSPTNGGPSANPTGILYDVNNPNVLKQQAIFGQLAYKLTSELKLTTGLRFYKFDVSSTDYLIGAGAASGNATPTLGGAHGSGSGVLPKVNLSYTPTSDLTVYGTIAEGARPGGVNIPIPLSTNSYYYCGPGSGPSYLTSQESYYRPDRTWSFEIGEKARLADRRITVNADIYYVDWLDIQQLFNLSCGYNFSANAGHAVTYGTELEVSAKLTDSLTANLSGAYTQAYINAPNTIPGLTIAPGTPINNIPRYTASANMEYETEIADGYRGIARINESYVGSMEDVAYYRETVPPYALMDGRAGVARNAWSTYLYCTNMANKRAELTIDNTTWAWQEPTITRATTNQPRTIGLQYQTKF